MSDYSIGQKTFSEEEQRLLALLETSHNFPCDFTFKLIVRSGGGVEQRLAALLCEAVAVDEPSSGPDLRSSSAGRFVSMTLDLPMQSGSDVLRIYRLIKDQPEVISYF